MDKFILFTALFLSSCFGQEVVRPDSGYAQLIIDINAQSRKGVRQPKREGSYETSVEDSWQFDRVDYRRFKDVMVILSSPHLQGGELLPLMSTVTIKRHKLDQSQVLLPLGGELTIINKSKQYLTFSYLAANEDAEIMLEPNERESIKFNEAGDHQVICDENESFTIDVKIITHRWAMLAQSNQSNIFQNVLPGEYQVIVKPPRFPQKIISLVLLPDESRQLKVDIGVKELIN